MEFSAKCTPNYKCNTDPSFLPLLFLVLSLYLDENQQKFKVVASFMFLCNRNVGFFYVEKGLICGFQNELLLLNSYCASSISVKTFHKVKFSCYEM